ncbi:MAG: heat-inducible transcriptional repressor HrcA [Parachlamydia sp.]|nr:heat-inducible transcriptional repressor HrcA [Parachlamydia sp.]
MKTLKPLSKKPSKQEREHKVLLGLIEYYLKTGKPVGSNTLKETGFEDLSSATIRNYFAKLEEEGYLTQQHISGGRIPTDRAYRAYAKEFVDSETPLQGTHFEELRNAETREIAGYLQKAAESLSTLTVSAIFLSAPRFDHDMIVGLKLVPIDHSRCLCVIITDFGLIQTEILQTDKRLTAFAVKRMESYFHWRLTGNDKPDHLSEEEEKLAQEFYNELMVRFIVGYANFNAEEVYRTGFSRLLNYPEFREPLALAGTLSLFENAHSMRLLLKECSGMNRLKFWIGDDLKNFCQESPNCSVLAIPYYINQQAVGAVGLLGPSRMAYRELFATLRAFSESISTALTRNIYKFKISFRQPQQNDSYLQVEGPRLIGGTPLMLIEDKS